MIDGICLHCVYMAMKTKTGLKASARKPAWILEILAPRPGLEPGTCGLTEDHATQELTGVNRSLAVLNGVLEIVPGRYLGCFVAGLRRDFVRFDDCLYQIAR